MLKRPDLLILDEATAAIEPAAQTALQAALLTSETVRGQVWVIGDVQHAEAFDHVIIVDAGRVVEQGLPADLQAERLPAAVST